MENLTPPAAGRCRAAAGLICWPSWSSSRRRRLSRAQAVRRGLLLYAAGRWAQVVRPAVVVIWCRRCRAAASSGRRVVLVCCWLSWSSSRRCRLSGAQAAQHHRAGRPRRARPGQKEKAQGGGAGGARVALGLCRRCWSATDPARPRRGGILPFAGGVRFSTLPGSTLGVGLELSEL